MAGLFKKKPKANPLVNFAAAIIVIAGLMAAKSLIIPILLAVFISIIAAQPVLWLQRRKVPPAVAIIIVLMGFLAVFTLMGGIVGRSLANFTQDAPKYEESLRNAVSGLISGANNLGFDISADQLFSSVDPGKVLNFTAGAVGEVGAIMSESFLILLISIFILAELRSFWFKADYIQETHNISLEYLDEVGKSIRHYLTMKTWISVGTGVFIAIWLAIVGVDYPVLWGLIAFALNYIPNIGSIIAAVPTMLLAYLQLGVGAMVWTGVGYLLVNTIMGNMVEPKIMGTGLGLSTLVVFLSLICWGFVFDTVGMFLSVPLTMSIKILLASNDRTLWIAVLLGTEKNAQEILDAIKVKR